MVGVAVKVTDVPAQMVEAVAAILTLTGKFGFTVMVIALLVAGFPVAHGVRLEVISTVTMSPWANAVEVYVLLLIPTLAPFTFHW